VLATLQQIRFAVSSRTGTLTTLLEPGPEEHVHPAGAQQNIRELAAALSEDLQQLHTCLPYTADGTSSIVTTSRILRRYQRAVAQHRLQHIAIAASEPLIVTLYAPQRATLYIPSWLVEIIPRTLLPPSASFSRPRPASLAWLLLDAPVVTSTYEFTTL
jgi:hypothetical protein